MVVIFLTFGTICISNEAIDPSQISNVVKFGILQIWMEVLNLS
jgi:hypothetical protein